MAKRLIITRIAIVMFSLLLALMHGYACAEDFSREISVFGFQFELEEGGEFAVVDEKLVLKGKGSLDLSKALGEGVVIETDEMTIDHDTIFSMKGINRPKIKIGDMTVELVTDELVIEKISRPGIDPYISLKADLSMDIAGETVAVAAELPISADGIKDTIIALLPPSDEEAFIKKEFDGVTLILDNGEIQIENGRVKNTSFNGKLDMYGTRLPLGSVNIDGGNISGSASTPDDSSIKIGSIALKMKGRIDFEYKDSSLNIKIAQVSVNLEDIIQGATGELTVAPFNVNDGKFDASGSSRQKIDIYGVGLIIDAFSLDTETEDSGTLLKLVMDGSVNIQEMGIDIPFEGLSMDSSGSISGEITMEEPEEFDMFGGVFSVEKLEFISMENDFRVNATGVFKMGDDSVEFTSMTIAQGGVDAEFDVSGKEPFSFEWFENLVVDNMDIKENTLKMSGNLNLPSPFELSIEFEEISFDSDGEHIKDEDTGGTDADREYKNLKTPGQIAIENKSLKPLDVAGFLFKVDAVVISNPIKVSESGEVPEAPMKLYMHAELPIGSDKKISLNVDGVELTEDGVKDMTITIPPQDGEDVLFELGSSDWAKLSITTVSLVFADNTLKKFNFSGNAIIAGYEFAILKFGFEDEYITGTLTPVKEPHLDFAGLVLEYQGEVQFKITGGGKGGGDPPDTAPDDASGSGEEEAGSETSFEFEVTLNNISIDFSSFVGSSMKINLTELVITNGSIDATVDLNANIELLGIKFGLESVNLNVSAEEGFTAYFDGSLEITQPSIKIAFSKFMINSKGELGGNLSLENAQQFTVFGFTFTVSEMSIAKEEDSGLEASLAGSIELPGGSEIGFKKISIKNGEIQAKIDISEDNPLVLPVCTFIKITSLEIGTLGVDMSGYIEIPDPISAKLNVVGLKLDSKGKLTGGKLNVDDTIVIGISQFNIAITKIDFDLVTRLLVFSGEIRLPADVFSKPFKFENMAISLAETGARMVTSSTSFDTKKNTSKANNLPISISSMKLGQRDGKFALVMKGSLSIMSGGTGKQSGFTLNFINFSVSQDLDINIGSITGGIKIGGFGVEVKRFELEDDYIEISGGLSLPAIGGVYVEGLKIYNSGKIELAGLQVNVDYKAYKIGVALSYKDSVLKASGNILIRGKELKVAGEFGPNYFSLDLDVAGLKIVLYPGVFLDSIGGGITCKVDPFYLEFRMRAGIAIVDADILYGKAKISVNSEGIINISGDMTAFTMFPVANVKIVIDVPGKSLTGSAKIKAPVMAPLLYVEADIQFAIDENNFRLYGKAKAKVLDTWEIGKGYVIYKSRSIVQIRGNVL